jgi:hypothetical protein
MPFFGKKKSSDKKSLQHLVLAATSSDPVLASTVSPSTTSETLQDMILSEISKKSINFENLYEEQMEKVSKSMHALNHSTTDFTQEFIIENFKLEILCIFAVLYPNIITIEMDKTNLKTHFTKFEQLINKPQSRVKILLFLNSILPNRVGVSNMVPTKEFSEENFKSEILYIFTVLYLNIIHDIDKNNLIRELKQFNYYMYFEKSRESILRYVNILKTTQLSGGMKHTRKVKRTKSKSKRTTYRK